MYNPDKIQEYLDNKKVLIYQGSNNKDYKYYIEEINDDLVSIVVDAPIKTLIWESDHQKWTLDMYNLLSHSKETNLKANWGLNES
tara:strand:- start:268 stop:522 length:255 start_codon:yes stop_codon:yes gene_type:complete